MYCVEKLHFCGLGGGGLDVSFCVIGDLGVGMTEKGAQGRCMVLIVLPFRRVNLASEI